jgi:hypothetical protein
MSEGDLPSAVALDVDKDGSFKMTFESESP